MRESGGCNGPGGADILGKEDSLKAEAVCGTWPVVSNSNEQNMEICYTTQYTAIKQSSGLTAFRHSLFVMTLCQPWMPENPRS